MKILGITFLSLPFVLASVIYAAEKYDPLAVIRQRPIPDPISAFMLPENATEKDKERAIRKYLLLKSMQKELKKVNKSG